MPASRQQRTVDISVPKITCPQCGGHMIISRTEPEGADNHDRIFFDCFCGFEYRLSDWKPKQMDMHAVKRNSRL
jgi:DNA-directed RNA polymerase subunit M/transcription elongation factor TFIIS